MGVVSRILEECKRNELARWMRVNPDIAREVISEVSIPDLAYWIEQGKMTQEVIGRLDKAMEEEKALAEELDEEYFDRIARAHDVAQQVKEGW